MFKKLKERIESVDESAVPKRPPGLAIRSPPADTEGRSFANEPLIQDEPNNNNNNMASQLESSDHEEVKNDLEGDEDGMEDIDDDDTTAKSVSYNL